MSNLRIDQAGIVAHEIAIEIARQRDKVILDQLNELVSRNLLVVQEGESTLVRDELTGSIELKQQVKLILKDQEYVEKLENEVEELRAAMKLFKEIQRKFRS